MSLKLYTNKESRGIVVEWLFQELNIDYERIEVAYYTEMKAPEFLHLNPFGKVPVLVDEKTVIYELGAICTYLADKYAEKGLAPSINDPKRGLYYRWLFMMAGPWEAACVDKNLGLKVADEQKMFVGYGSYDDAYTALIQGLSEAEPYLCGGQFTAADICVGAMLLWQDKMGEIQPHPILERYLNTLRQRESLKLGMPMLAS
ncbi:glutathione S-transferase family protein [Acinetobacter ihumii]|uniref:glutathione S-transferase family protein n=1 Tax=Acinetobacter ihumii TaxID=2483802 RepID=UPI001031538A|nr:glutathione S-transferase family protein [Acinetobacter ihumii]